MVYKYEEFTPLFWNSNKASFHPHTVAIAKARSLEYIFKFSTHIYIFLTHIAGTLPLPRFKG